MSRFARSFSVNYIAGSDKVETRLVNGLKAAEEDGRGYPLKIMRRRMCVGTIIDEISEGLSDSILKLDDKGILNQMDVIHKAEMLIELVKHEIAQKRIVDAMYDKAKSAKNPTDTGQNQDSGPESGSVVEPGEIKSPEVKIAEYQDPKKPDGPKIRKAADICA